MRILLINYEFPPIGGGGANANYYLLRELAGNKDFQIDLVTSSETASDKIIAFSDNIVLHKLNIGKKRLHYWTQREVLTFLYRSNNYVKTLMKERNFDLCHAFFGFPSGYIAYRMRKKLPYVVSLRGSDVPGFNERFSLQYILLKPLFRRIWRASKKMVANSRDLGLLALETTPRLPIDIIHNGIDTAEFYPADVNKKRGRNMLVVSRLIRRKGLEYLISAIPAILEKHPDAKLTIAGEGNIEDELHALASGLGVLDNIFFLGRLDHDRLPDLYREADIFVLPSLWEGMSNTVLEAIACGLPVVVTDTGGTKELVSDNGIIIPKESSSAIASAVVRLFDDDSLSDSMGAKSRETALHFNWTAVARQYIQIYEEVIG